MGPDLLDFLRKKKYDVRNRSIQKTHVLQIDVVNHKGVFIMKPAPSENTIRPASESSSPSAQTSNRLRSYHDEKDIQNTLQLREILKEFPPFAKQYFLGIESTTATRTRLSYAYDIRTFFRYLQENNPILSQKDILTWAAREETYTNGEKGLKRKMSALRSFYAYYFKRQMIQTNPTLLVDMPKLHEKAIVRLDAGESAALLDLIEHGGDNLTGQKKRYYEKTRLRDLAIVTLLLGTGIRVSECVGLDVTDVDFRNNGIRIIRKGEVEKALKDYLEERTSIIPQPGEENALFYSTQRRRMGVQAVENMVKKYARQITTTKKITPHKLRSTYGTALYQQSTPPGNTMRPWTMPGAAALQAPSGCGRRLNHKKRLPSDYTSGRP